MIKYERARDFALILLGLLDYDPFKPPYFRYSDYEHVTIIEVSIFNDYIEELKKGIRL